MREVPVAFPNDETSAEVIASRLRTEGIPARVDLGLAGSFQVPSSRGHARVLVPERDAARSHQVLGTRVPEERESGLLVWALIAVLIAVLLFAIVAMVMTVTR